MKRILMFSFIIVLGLVCLTACQATPEEPVVIQKDMEQMIEKAGATDAGQTQGATLRERTGAPENYSDYFTGSDGKLIINVDAAVTVPDANAMPIYRVHSAGFPEELAESVYQLLCGDTKMYAASESFTKDAIMEEILEQQQILASGNLDDEARNGTEAYIEQLQKDYQNAPDTMGTPITSVTFQTKQEYGAPYTYFEVRENEAGEGGKYFDVRNDTQYKNEEIQTVDEETVAPRSNAHLTFYDADIGLAEPYELREVLGDEKVDELKTTPIQAQAMAEDLLKKIGIEDMKIYSICLIADKSQAATQYGYHVKLRRMVDGICVNSPARKTFVDDPGYAFEWNYETLSIGVNDEGIYSFDWDAPLEIGAALVGNATLKPFNEIMDVFQNMMCIVNEPDTHIADRYKLIEFDITGITLSLQRISQQNSVTSGLLTPVWNFYGDKTFTEPDGTSYTLSERAKSEEPGDAVENIHYPFLSINAVDGSIIDTSKGY